MNTYLLVCVNKPERFDEQRREQPQWGEWLAVLDGIAEISSHYKGIEKLSETAWLFHLPECLLAATEFLRRISGKMQPKTYIEDKPKLCD